MGEKAGLEAQVRSDFRQAPIREKLKVLIAAMVCMFNRYVDGLAAWTPEQPEIYEQIGQMLAERGYSHEVVAAAS